MHHAFSKINSTVQIRLNNNGCVDTPEYHLLRRFRHDPNHMQEECPSILDPAFRTYALRQHLKNHTSGLPCNAMMTYNPKNNYSPQFRCKGIDEQRTAGTSYRGWGASSSTSVPPPLSK